MLRSWRRACSEPALNTFGLGNWVKLGETVPVDTRLISVLFLLWWQTKGKAEAIAKAALTKASSCSGEEFIRPPNGNSVVIAAQDVPHCTWRRETIPIRTLTKDTVLKLKAHRTEPPAPARCRRRW